MPPGRLARSRHALSRTRQAEGPIRSFGVDAGPGGLVPPQPAGWAHLVSVRSGIAELRCERVRAFVTPNVAYWIPNGTPYALDLRTQTRLRILYADDAVYSARAFGPVSMRPLLRELLERAMSSGFLDARHSTHEHVLAVIEDELAALTAASGANVLVFPRDGALYSAAERLASEPDHGRSVAAIAASTGMSRRTFERRFANETGLAPSEWLRRARLLAAMVMLSSGASVTDAGLACGYTSISAFISAFRRVHGVTPGKRIEHSMIRPVRATDAEAWGALRAGLWPDAPAAELMHEARSFFDAPLPAIAVAWVAIEDDGAALPIGFIEASVRAFADGCDSMPVPHIEGWYVEYHARGRGFGGALMRAAENWARAAGFREIASDTEVENAASLHAHEACGFQEVERLIKLRKSLE